MEKYYLKREDCILLVIDIQEKLLPAMRCQERLIKNNNLLLATARTLGIPVYLTEQYVRGLGETVKELDFSGLVVNKLEKMTFSAVGPELLAWLEKAKRSHIIVTGIETHVCVYQTTRDLLQLGYQCHLVSDAVDSRFEHNYLNALELMRDQGAVITNTETVMFDLLNIAGTPEFKALAPLLR